MQPPIYVPQTSFITYQAQQAWFPGQNLDVEFNTIRSILATVRADLVAIQKDDTTLANGIVGWDQLSPTFQTALKAQGFNPGQATTAFNVALEINLSGQANTVWPPGSRGPFFVWNDPSSTLTGQTTNATFWLGANPTGTPAASGTAGGGFINTLIVSTNGNNRDVIWGANIVAGQSNLGSGFVQGNLVGLEIDTYSDPTWTQAQDPFSANYVTNLQLYNSGFSPTTNALFIWGPDTTGAHWFYEGISISRCINYGIRFYQVGGDAANAYSTAAIFDGSNSAISYKVTGTHTTLIDASGATLSGFAFKSPGFTVKGNGAEVNIGASASNGLGLGTSLAINVGAGTSGVQLQTAGAIRGYFTTTGTLVELGTAGALSLFFLINNATQLIMAANSFLPNTDNVLALGSGSFRFASFAATTAAFGAAAATFDSSGNLATSGTLATTNSTASSSTSTGALKVSGGIGLLGALFAGGAIDGASTINAATALKVAGTQVVSARATGWTVATGTPQRSTFTTGGVTLPQLAGVVMALEQDLIAHGLIGP